MDEVELLDFERMPRRGSQGHGFGRVRPCPGHPRVASLLLRFDHRQQVLGARSRDVTVAFAPALLPFPTDFSMITTASATVLRNPLPRLAAIG